jgi:uncharacterized membrane protein
MPTSRLKELLTAERQQFDKIDEIFRRLKMEEASAGRGIDLNEVEIPFASKVADRVARVGGSWWFIGSFVLFMAFWIVLNIYFLTRPFDNYPFILLNLLLSTLAALQAPVIMMSQNRKEEKDRRRAVSDYLINLKAEVEVRSLHTKLDHLMTEQMQTLFEIQNAQFKLMEEIKRILNETEMRNHVVNKTSL